MGGDETTGTRDERPQFQAGDGALFVDRAEDGVVDARGLNPPSARARPTFAEHAARLWGAIRADLAAEWARGAAFLCLPVCLGVGALIYFTLPFEPSIHVMLAAIGACMVAYFLSREQIAFRIGVSAVLLVLFGLGAGNLETWQASTAMMGSGVTTRVTGRVVQVEERADGRVRVTLDIRGTQSPHLRYAPERIRATARSVPSGLAPGEGVKGLVHLMAPSGPVRPGGYDFSFQSYFDGLGAVGFFMGNPERATLAEPATAAERFLAGVETVRQRLARHVRTTIGGAEGAMAAALITGMRSSIPEAVEESLRRAGLAHILAISGLHMALVAVTVMAGIRAVFACFPGFSSLHPVRKYAAAAALCVCAAYLLMSGAEVAARRSFIMLSIMLVAILFDRAAITMRNLAVAALVVLVFSPHEVVGPSFQMSFSATAALIAGYSAWSEWRSGRLASDDAPTSHTARSALRTVATYGGGLAMTSLIAGLATAIYAVWHFQRLAPLGLLANLGAMPVVSLIVMPFAVLAVVLMPLGLDAPALWVMGKGVAAVIWVAERVASLSPLDATGMIPGNAVLCLSGALVIATIATTRLRLLALPLLAAGVFLIADRELPDALIAEDGAMIAVHDVNGGVSANVARADDFIMDNWLRAFGASAFQSPLKKPDSPIHAPGGNAKDHGFVCGKGVCVASSRGGALVASADDPEAARSLCGRVALIVLEDAMARDTCAHTRTHVITTRELARRGSVAVRFAGRNEGGSSKPTITHAVAMPWRPWHTQRAYSRAARGLPPYRAKD